MACLSSGQVALVLFLFPFQPIFNDGMLCHFLNVLLQVLVRRSHDLLQEEIAIALYNMASSDFDKFYLRFLPDFLTHCDGLFEEQKSELSKTFKMDKVRVNSWVF